jgi:hypothetical protein
MMIAPAADDVEKMDGPVDSRSPQQGNVHPRKFTSNQFNICPDVTTQTPVGIQLANPATHLAAFVENRNECTASVSQDGDNDDVEEGNDAEERPFDSALQVHGYSMEQLQEYLSDSESSCDEPESGHIDRGL